MVIDYRSTHEGCPVSILSLLRRELSAMFKPLMGLVRETRETLFPPAVSGGTILYLQGTASTKLAANTELASGAELLLFLALVTCFFCDTACSTVIGIFTDRLVAPFWHRARDHHRASAARSAGHSRSLRQWLCSPSRNEKNFRPCRSTRVSQNRAPPRISLLSTYSYT